MSVSLDHVQEQVGLKSLIFLDLTEDRVYEEKLVRAFRQPYDLFLFSSNIQDAIRMLCRAVKIGRIAQAEIDRRVMKLLILKAQHSA